MFRATPNLELELYIRWVPAC